MSDQTGPGSPVSEAADPTMTVEERLVAIEAELKRLAILIEAIASKAR